MADELSTTLTFSAMGPVEARPAHTPHQSVVLIVNRSDLSEPSARLHLNGLTTVKIVRGDGDRSLLHAGEQTPAGRLTTIALASARVTRNHAVLQNSTLGWFIRDEGSKNGTVVDGRALVGERVHLADGSSIDIGDCVFIFHASRPATLPPVEPMSLECEADLLKAGLATFHMPLSARFAELRQLAPTVQPILILGETGTGKERVALAVHELSGRQGRFVAVNCGAIQPSTMMAELFGHKKSAFTGADGHRLGYFRSADAGTLFLDEVGELSMDGQRALLRALQEREVLPVGADHPVTIDVRIVAATNRNLEAMVVRGEFRSDLLARLRGFDLVLPRLAERREDFGLILRDIMRRNYLNPKVEISAAAFLMLFAYDWPQNIRELENVLVRAARLAKDARIEQDHLTAWVQERRPKKTVPPAVAEVPAKRVLDLSRREDVVELLTVHAGNVAAVARALVVDDKTVRRWLERHALDVDGFRKLRRR